MARCARTTARDGFPAAAQRCAAWRISCTSSGARASWETSRKPRTRRSGSSESERSETVRRTRFSRSSCPPNGSTSSPSASRRAIAFTVKSRRARSSSTDADASTTISKSCRPGPVLRSRRGGASSMPLRASLRISSSRGQRRRPTRCPATSRSSTRPCGSSSVRSSSWPTPRTRKSASLESSPSSSSRTAPPTRYASSPSERT